MIVFGFSFLIRTLRMPVLMICLFSFFFFLGGRGEGVTNFFDLVLADVVNYEQMFIPTEEMLI